MSCRVAVAAHNGHAGQGTTLFGSDHVHDALQWVAHREQFNAELFGIVAHDFNLASRDWVSDRQVDVGRWHIVVFGGHGEFGATNRAIG